MTRPALALLLIVLLAVAEIAVFCGASGHSVAHVLSLGIIPDHPRMPP